MALGALVVLVVNDQWAKHHVPSMVTGKASDVTGLVVAPLVLAAVVELVSRGRWPARRVLAVAVAVVGLAFTVVQVVPWAGEAWRYGLGWLQWPLRWLADPGVPLRPVVHTADLTDLLALPALGVPWLLHERVGHGGTQGRTPEPDTTGTTVGSGA